MKKILFCTVVSLVCFFTVKAQKEKQKVPGITTVLRMVPDSIVFVVKEDTSFFIYDKPNEALLVTKNGSLFRDIRSYLSLRRELGAAYARTYRLESAFIEPLTLYSRSQLRKLSKHLQQQGVAFNERRIYKIFNYLRDLEKLE